MRRSAAAGSTRRGALVAVLVAATALTAACTRFEEYTFTNATDVVLTGRGIELGPGETETIDDRDCLHSFELTTVDRSARAVVDRLCGGESVTITPTDLSDVSATATLRNASTGTLTVSIWDDRGFSRVPVAAGEDLAITLVRAPGTCTEEKVYALTDDRSTALIAPRPLCDGDVWTVDDAVVAAGSAAVTVVNETSDRLDLYVATPEWRFERTLHSGHEADVPLGAPVGECVDDASVVAVRLGSSMRQEAELRASVEGRLCEETWRITDADLS